MNTTKRLTPEVERKVKFYKCSRCGHEWQHRRKDAKELPVTCQVVRAHIGIERKSRNDHQN